VQEEYSDFKTLEARLQDVARRLVHRPGPGSSQGTPGLLPNGVFDPSNAQQPQPGAQQLGVQQQPGTPTQQQTMLTGGQAVQPGAPGMVPAPNTTVGDSTDLLVKPEPANGMVPLEGAAAAAADPGASLRGSSMPGMVPVSGMMGGSSAMGASLMSNGAPIIKQDAWSMPSPSMVQVGDEQGWGLCGLAHSLTWPARRFHSSCSQAVCSLPAAAQPRSMSRSDTGAGVVSLPAVVSYCAACRLLVVAA
jgi:hypothetical protein